MKLLISLDYELFFGRKTGTVQACLIDPVDRLLTIVNQCATKLSLFVDAGFLLHLKVESKKYLSLGKEYSAVCRQLENLVKNGHDVQLHIHSHWEDSYFDGERWQIDVSRYRLHDFSSDEICQIVADYKNLLSEVSNADVFAYRAGGWCLQPFTTIRNALITNDVWLDSTVYENGLSEDVDRFYDFRNMPDKPYWLFDTDPLQVDESGKFLELPISAMKMNPLFYWKLLFVKKLLKGQFRSFGNGEYILSSKRYYFDRLFKQSLSPVTLDGVKAGLLDRAFRQQTSNSVFNIMGHPKTLSEYSLKKLARFLASHKNLESVTFQDFKYLKPESF